MAGPMRCRSPRRYACASTINATPIAMKISPAQKSFGDRMRIVHIGFSGPREARHPGLPGAADHAARATYAGARSVLARLRGR